MRRLQFEVVCVCLFVCVRVHEYIRLCVFMCMYLWVERGKQCLVVCLSLSWVLVCLAACVCISDSPRVFVSACMSGWVGVQWGSRRAFGSHCPLPTSNCPWCPAELPNDFTYTSLICLARMAATVWRFSLYMPFAASYPVKFNCTAPTVARVGGSPSLSLLLHSLFLYLPSPIFVNTNINSSTITPFFPNYYRATMHFWVLALWIWHFISLQCVGD